MRREATSARQGVEQGFRALTAGVVGGISGVVTQPIGASQEGWRRAGAAGGALGFGKGAAQALVGFVAKPLAGLSTLSAKLAEGVANQIKYSSRGAHSGSGTRFQQQLRARQPRQLEPGGALLPYPPPPNL
jgi:Vacuolar protein sorting-associated protein